MFKGLLAKLAVSYLAPVCLSMSLLGLYLIYSFEDFHLDRMHQDLAYDATLVARLVSHDLSAGSESLPNLVRDLRSTRSPDIRILVFDRLGQPVASSFPEDERSLNPGGVDPAVEKALQGESTMQREGIPASNQEAMYAAVPVQADGQIVGAVKLAYSLSHMEPIVRRLRLLVASGVALAALLAVGVSMLLGETISRPVRRLAQAARAVAAGEMSQRVEVRSQDELRLLADSFNHMSARLVALEEARRAFLADVAHDLRSPVGAMRAGVEALLGGAQEDPALRARLLRGVEAALGGLVRVTDDLVQLARFEAGQMEFAWATVQLSRLVQEAALRFEAEAKRQGLRLEVEVRAEMSLVQGDEDRLAQVLNNLVSNAIKFTAGGGTIILRAGEGPDHVWASVADAGVGIRAEDLPHVFDRFYRGDAGQGKRGMGLGLAIVRYIVEGHGGTVDVISEYGRGSVFTFTLPK